MPITDPTFQHSDEDWTQITQPRLRKRVQNRVSQRKHRDKVRQQRADSVDAGHIASVPVNADGYWPPNCPLPSDDSSAVEDVQCRQRDSASPKQQQLETTFFPNQDGFEGPNHYNGIEAPDYASTHLPWIGGLPSTYSQPSTYSTMPPMVPSDYSHPPNTYRALSNSSSKRPSISSSTDSSGYDAGRNCVDTTPYGLSQQWYHMQSASLSPSSYSTRYDSAGPSPIDCPQLPLYTAWQPQRAGEFLSGYTPGATPLDVVKPTYINGNGYHSNPSANGGSVAAGTLLPTSSMKSAHTYPPGRVSTNLLDDVESRGSDINPSYYKPGKHRGSLSRSKRPPPPRY